MPRRWLPECSGVPVSVMFACFITTWAQSFPMTAIRALLTDELGMSLSAINTYYAVTFLPWTWKPLFGWLSDSFPIGGYRRIPYIMISALGCAAGHLGMAFWVSSAWQAFAASLFLASCSAFLQLMIFGFLVDVARQDLSNSVAIQSVANAAKWCGTLVAQVMAIMVYAHGSGDAGTVIKTRPAIAMTAGPFALIFFLAPGLPEARATGMQASCRGQHACKWERVRYIMTIALVQLNLVLVGCQSLMDLHTWWCSLAITAAISLCLLAASYSLGGCNQRAQGAAERQALPSQDWSQHGTCWWVRLCAFCFLVNACPTSGVVMGQFQYSIFTAESYQSLSIISSLASLVATCAFGGVFNRWSIVRTLAVTTLAAAIAGLAPLPFAALAKRGYIMRQQLWSPVGTLGVGATVLGSFAEMFAVLPVDVLVTWASGCVAIDRAATSYAVLLSCYDLGATMGGLATSPVLAAVGLTGKDWGALPAWIAATAALRFLTLVLLPLVPAGRSAAADAGQQQQQPAVGLMHGEALLQPGLQEAGQCRHEACGSRHSEPT